MKIEKKLIREEFSPKGVPDEIDERDKDLWPDWTPKQDIHEDWKIKKKKNKAPKFRETDLLG